jgi:hypothetical protein
MESGPPTGDPTQQLHQEISKDGDASPQHPVSRYGRVRNNQRRRPGCVFKLIYLSDNRLGFVVRWVPSQEPFPGRLTKPYVISGTGQDSRSTEGGCH